MERTNTLAAVFAITLDRWPDDLIAPLHLALLSGSVPPYNLSFDRAVKDKLVKPDGSQWDDSSLITAVEHVVASRVEAGTWGKSTEVQEGETSR